MTGWLTSAAKVVVICALIAGIVAGLSAFVFQPLSMFTYGIWSWSVSDWGGAEPSSYTMRQMSLDAFQGTMKSASSTYGGQQDLENIATTVITAVVCIGVGLIGWNILQRVSA